MAQNIIIRLLSGAENDRKLAQELATEAVDIAFDYSARYPYGEAGTPHGVGYQRLGYDWSARWTKTGAVVVRCEREVTNG